MDVAAKYDPAMTGPRMQTRDEFDEAQALFDEAVATYEAAKAEFEEFKLEFRSRLRENPDLEALELAKWKLYRSRARLMRLFRAKERRGLPT
jgi:hypothetical protein